MMVWISTEMYFKANVLYCLAEKMDWMEITWVWIHLVRFGASLRTGMFLQDMLNFGNST